MLGRSDLGEAEVKRAREIILASGGLEAVSQMIEARLADARSALDEAPLEAEQRAFFEGLIEYSEHRDR